MKLIVANDTNLKAVINDRIYKTLIIPEGQTIKIDTDISPNIGASQAVTLFFECGAKIAFEGNGKLLWHGFIQTELPFQHIFDITASNHPETTLHGIIKNPEIHIEWFGGKSLQRGNTIIDSTQAFKAALELGKAVMISPEEYNVSKRFVDGKVVQLNTGYYYINDTLTVPSGVQIKGYGPTRTFLTDSSSGGLDYMLYFRKDNSEGAPFGNYIKINELTIAGKGSNSGEPSSWTTETLISAIECTYAIHFDNCRFQGGKNLIRLERCFGNVSITNSHLTLASQSILNLISCHGFKMDHCRVEACKNLVPDTPSAAITIGTGGNPIIFSNTFFQFNSGYAIWSNTANQINIQGCYFEDNFHHTSRAGTDENGNAITDKNPIGAHVLLKNTSQANILGNLFAQTRPNGLENSTNPPQNYAFRILSEEKDILLDVRGNRIINAKHSPGAIGTMQPYILGGNKRIKGVGLPSADDKTILDYRQELETYIHDSNYIDLDPEN
ncbi:right-handed parallel beta-helix repeat-containing protein [Aquimarina rhabdastrellae]